MKANRGISIHATPRSPNRVTIDQNNQGHLTLELHALLHCKKLVAFTQEECMMRCRTRITAISSKDADSDVELSKGLAMMQQQD